MTEVGRRKTVWVDTPPRMKPRRLKSGKILYYYRAGKKEIPLGSNRTIANEEWTRLENGGAAVKLWPAVTALYRKDVFPDLAINTRRRYGAALDNWDAYFKLFSLEQVEPQHIKKYMRLRSKKGAATLEKKIGSAFFEWARGEGHTKAPNPFNGVRFSKAEKKTFDIGPRKRYVTDAEFDAVRDAGDATLQDAMDLALYTGQRPGDILNAKRQHIIDGVLWFKQEKTGAEVGVKVQGELARVLERILTRPRAVPSMYLIPDRQGQRLRYPSLNRRFVKACGDADWQFRDIRAKAATDSPDLKRAQQLLGHSAETTTAGTYRRQAGNIVAPLERKA